MDITARCSELREARGRSPEPERLRALCELTWDYLMIEQPEAATYVGYPGQNHRWTDSSLGAIERRERGVEELRDLLLTIDRERLEPDDGLNYDLLRRHLDDGVEGARFKGEYMPIEPMGGPHLTVPHVLQIMPALSGSQCQDILARLAGIPTLIEQAITLMDRGIETGRVPPRIVLREVPSEVERLASGAVEGSPFLHALTTIPPDATDAEAGRARVEAEALLRDRVAPAFRRFHEYLVGRYVPACRDTIAWTDLPDGPDWYAFLVRHHTTTEMKPEEIHEIGLSEVARIHGEMEEVLERSDFGGSFAEFNEFLRTDRRFFFEDAESLLVAYRDIAKRADAELVKLFGRLPRLPYGVVPVPEYQERTATTAYYQPGAPGRAGYFYANTYNLSARPKWEMEALCLHEAVPGHHLQLALAQELEGLPEFRKHGHFTAYVEGWGLYAESLGREMGFYRDLHSRFGALTYEMWRAIRLVVDTGMHALGWSRDRAIELFKEHTGRAEHDIVVEVDRYIAWAGQALAYKVGELTFQELRAESAAELGEAFDVRAFHDEVLGQGSLPMEILKERTRAWVAARRAASTS